MKKLLSIALAWLTFSFAGSAQKEGLNSINKNDLKAHMTFFASDELQGRETGTISNEVAALYIKNNLMRLGLKPIPESQNYFQTIPLVSKKISIKETYLKINDSKGNVLFSTDSLVYMESMSETMDFTGDVVFAGYGYNDTISGYNDLKDVDLKDKIVLIMTGKPHGSGHIPENYIIDINLEENKLGSVFSKGPRAILYVYDPNNKFDNAYSSGLADIMAGPVGSTTLTLKSNADVSIPLQLAFITQHAADMLLKPTGYNLNQMQEKINSCGKPVSVQLPGITATVKTSIETTYISSSNVIGIVEGSDPVLKNECIIYSAHFDHEGVNDAGEVFNGADDDASGSMALIELAGAFMNLKKKPLRSVVFAWVNGEEKGLLGSKYYSENPVIPMEKTIVDINLDMVGRSKMASDTGTFMGYELTVTQPGEILVYTAHESTELLKILESAAKETSVKVVDMGRDLPFGSSDHVSFMEKGVPAFFFTSGIHSDVHTIRDDVDKIDFDKMENVTKMVFLLGYKVANQRERVKLDNSK